MDQAPTIADSLVMTPQLWSSVIFSILRHGLSMLGGAIVVKDHEGDLMTLAGAIVAIAPVIISVRRSRRHAVRVDELESKVADAEETKTTPTPDTKP